MDTFTWTRDLRNLFEAIAAGKVARRPDGSDWRAAPGLGKSTGLTNRRVGPNLRLLADAKFVELADSTPGAWSKWQPTGTGVASYAADTAVRSTAVVTVRVDAAVVR